MGAYDWRGSVLEQQGRWGEALRLYEKMMSLFPNEAVPYVNLARVSDMVGETENTKKYIRKAVRLNPELSKNPGVQKILER